MGNVERPERFDPRLRNHRALSTEFKEHIDRGQHALDLRQDRDQFIGIA
jgi:hypothetical protein